jgi:hypothetical protein
MGMPTAVGRKMRIEKIVIEGQTRNDQARKGRQYAGQVVDAMQFYDRSKQNHSILYHKTFMAKFLIFNPPAGEKSKPNIPSCESGQTGHRRHPSESNQLCKLIDRE